MALRLAGIGSPEEKIGQLSQENVSSSAYTVSFRANVTGYSGIVTGDSGRSRKIGHLQSESAVTFGRNNRSRSNGISGQIGAEYAIGRLIDGNIDRLQGWLDEIAEKQGALAALRCLVDLLEYHVPKLTRAELTVDKAAEGRANFDPGRLSDEDRVALRLALTSYQEIMARHNTNELARDYDG